MVTVHVHPINSGQRSTHSRGSDVRNGGFIRTVPDELLAPFSGSRKCGRFCFSSVTSHPREACRSPGPVPPSTVRPGVQRRSVVRRARLHRGFLSLFTVGECLTGGDKCLFDSKYVPQIRSLGSTML
ncbi:hypothetical protein CSUI_004609 [Cystoisospora suis]|uniref:Uncharacterized protein n=1 Tax=Cystoisospora suis TaxID=483139 RepID=A0A2C6L0D7_9APIC|nr:hypothetical protein CSUI_004609 [Cystoisospora suis]